MRHVLRIVVFGLAVSLAICILSGCDDEGQDTAVEAGGSTGTTLGQQSHATVVDQTGSTLEQQDGATLHRQQPVIVRLRLGTPVEFEFAGATHAAELVRVEGTSTEVVIASDSPTTYVLTEGQDAEADLDGDAVPDALLAVSEVGADTARLSAEVIEKPEYDETAFATQGGLAPYNARTCSFVDPSLVLLDDGDFLLVYGSGSAKRLQWEVYDQQGGQIVSPQLGAGRTRWTPGGDLEQYDPCDTVRVGDRIYLTFRAKNRCYIAAHDLNMNPVGAPAFLTTWDRSMPLATDGEHLWLATQVVSERPGQTKTSEAVAISELAPGDPPSPCGLRR